MSVHVKSLTAGWRDPIVAGTAARRVDITWRNIGEAGQLGIGCGRR